MSGVGLRYDYANCPIAVHLLCMHAHGERAVCTYREYRSLLIETLPAVRTCRLDSFQNDRKYFLGVPTCLPIYCVMYETSRAKAASTRHKRGMLCDNWSIARGPLVLGIGNRRTSLLERQADLHAFMIRVNTPSRIFCHNHHIIRRARGKASTSTRSQKRKGRPRNSCSG